LLTRSGYKGKPPVLNIPQKQEEPEEPYGSADWEEPRGGIPNAGYIFDGVFFGKSSRPDYAHIATDSHQGAPICSTPGNHTLIIGRTRVGKGCRVVIPTLLRANLVKRSALIVDPKGELAAVTARARREPFAGKDFHTDVHIINPWGELKPTFQKLGLTPFATYNPLDLLDRNDPNVTSIAQSMAAAICPTEKGTGNAAFWSQSAANILTGVLLWLTYTPGETKTLGRAREIVTKPQKEFQDEFLIPMAAVSDPAWRAITQNAGPFVGMALETFSGIQGNLAQFTSFLSDPLIDAATATSSFSMLDLIRKPTSIYLVIPPHMMEVQRTWLRLMISAGMQTYKHHASQNAQRCMFLIDEFPALGRLDEIPRDLATMAGYGVDFTLIAQGIDQLTHEYGKAANTIINNCAYKWFCGVHDPESAEYLSKMLGKKTVQTQSGSTSMGFNPGGGTSGSSTSFGQTGRDLMMPAEIINLGRDAAILLAPGDKPHYLRPIDYWDLQTAFANLREFYPHLYWEPPMRWDENPLPH
jgi:type IV secretion system protein VirD4